MDDRDNDRFKYPFWGKHCSRRVTGVTVLYLEIDAPTSPSLLIPAASLGVIITFIFCSSFVSLKLSGKSSLERFIEGPNACLWFSARSTLLRSKLFSSFVSHHVRVNHTYKALKTFRKTRWIKDLERALDITI